VIAMHEKKKNDMKRLSVCSEVLSFVSGRPWRTRPPSVPLPPPPSESSRSTFCPYSRLSLLHRIRFRLLHFHH
jgi:hypothetical protein